MEPMDTGNDVNLIAAIIADHRNVERVFTELEARQIDGQRRRELTDHVITELVRHSVAEEHWLYPAVREHLAGGEDLADHEISEHADAEELMKRMENLSGDDPQLVTYVEDLIRSIRHHVAEEEDGILPRLQSACSEEKLRDLGGKMMRAKENAPTRPHPGAPDRPPANFLVDAGAGLIDRMRDGLSRQS